MSEETPAKSELHPATGHGMGQRMQKKVMKSLEPHRGQQGGCRKYEGGGGDTKRLSVPRKSTPVSMLILESDGRRL